MKQALHYYTLSSYKMNCFKKEKTDNLKISSKIHIFAMTYILSKLGNFANVPFSM